MTRFAYSDGSKEDLRYYAQKASKRRSEMSADQLVKKLLEYLEQHMEMIDLDIERVPEKAEANKLRREWVEGMIFFVNHNL